MRYGLPALFVENDNMSFLFSSRTYLNNKICIKKSMILAHKVWYHDI